LIIIHHCLNYFKITEKDIKKNSVFDFVHPDYIEVAKSNMKNENTGYFEILAIKSDKTSIPVELKAKNAVFNNEIVRVVSINDITERKAIEKQIRQLSSAVIQSPVSIVITNLDGEIEYTNPTFTKITGYTKEEAIGKSPSILKTGHTSEKEYEELWDKISKGEIWEGEFYNQKKDGSYYWEFATISPIKNDKGEIINYLAVKEDITKRKENEEALMKSEQELKIANATKDRFFSYFSS
jgi:PAS domain S-box-containing protein